jgi:hypothetical protein
MKFFLVNLPQEYFKEITNLFFNEKKFHEIFKEEISKSKKFKKRNL